jgi:RimJ/RimL family protein N-acetyltransferase
MTMLMNYAVLNGNHGRLEPLEPSHTQGLFEAGQTVEDWKYLPIPGLQCLQDAAGWVNQALALAERKEHFAFVQVNVDSGTVMGSSRYLNVRPNDHVVEVGYTWLGRAFQRSPANTEAKLLLLSNAFDTMGANRVELKTDARNQQSQAAIERIGAKREGVLRHHMIAQGGYLRDSVMFSIIRPEWPSVRARLQEMLASYKETTM